MKMNFQFVIFISLQVVLLFLLLPTNALTDDADQTEVTPVDVTILILNQRHKLHEKKALELLSNLQESARNVAHLSLDVQVGSLSFPHLAYWTFFPLLEQFQKSKSDWFVIVDELVTIDLENLLSLLTEKSNSSYLGRSLSDAESTGIHHYANPRAVPRYPDTRTGFILAGYAFLSAADKFDPSAIVVDNQFIIDPGYEFSKWLLENTATRLEDTTRMCVAAPGMEKVEGCAITAHGPHICQPEHPGSPAKIQLHVAIKTYSGHHEERLPVLHSTWLPQAATYALYSDVTDATYGTVSSGVPNTERGHCAKTLAILRLALEDQWQWLLLADDDTLVSLPRLSAALSCYSSAAPLALGEVYGYRSSPHMLISYQTGGSGMVFSRKMVSKLTTSPWCSCRSPDEPDDMMLGMCLNRLGSSVLHLRDMHQNTPSSYSAGRLYGSSPISFHNFWLIDPVVEYERWLYEPLVSPAHDDL